LRGIYWIGSSWWVVCWYVYPPYQWPYLSAFRETWRRNGRASYHLYLWHWMLELKPSER